MSIRSLVFGALLALYVVQFRVYAETWQNELTVWRNAVAQAPMKPRPLINLAVACMERREYRQAQFLLDHLGVMARTRDDLPAWDRADALVAWKNNSALLSRLAGPTLR